MNLLATLFGYLFGGALVRFAKPLMFIFAALVLLTTLVCLFHLNGAMQDAHARNTGRTQHSAAQPRN